MARIVKVAAAQLGPIAKTETREMVVKRLIALLEQASIRGCDLAVFPELALTTFFPHWEVTDPVELDSYYEKTMPEGPVVALFEAAKRLSIGFSLGYAELDGQQRFNSSVLVSKEGQIVGKYRKVHLPGYSEIHPEHPFQNLEKMYFEVGDLGFPVFDAFGGKVGMAICNDRRWPETYRILALQGVELITLGYNTPLLNPGQTQSPAQRLFHNRLCMQAGAYQNSTWVVGVAKAGLEEGCDMMAGTCIIAPTGEIVAETSGIGDELAVAECDLDACLPGKEGEFNLKLNRRPEKYGLLIEVL
ncbi:N-carbamoyl-D-amino-acid hydrolase [Glaciimonas sp. PAMC28666]|uniref:N-carbamoyl-D-amino-acid hydrolase n=1 Tax=Glaciimonas sp. PAMC28666 TaxID=2807626 RepID=UPI00196580DF|nr:N-carbamoyl-D-amino-acid hydrolase [Glaciimonas sp. PAMC28666]QRX81775.1 N-carbamoyl-D-amino-acid hydrolase [Glaciimonas sp. PAMC28666]